jgi:hypothetical protein
MSEMMNAAGPATAAGTFKATGPEYAANVLKGLGVAYNVQMLRAGGKDSAQGLANEFGVGFAVSLAGEGPRVAQVKDAMGAVVLLLECCDRGWVTC